MSPRASRSRRGLRWTGFAALLVSAVLPTTVLLLTYAQPTYQDPCSTPSARVPYPVTAAVCGWVGLVCAVLCLALGTWWLRAGDAMMTGWQHGRWVLIMVFAAIALIFDVGIVWSLHGAGFGAVPDCWS